MSVNYLDDNGLLYFWQKIKSFVTGRIPTKTSDLTNDSGYITSADIPEGAAASSTTPKMDGTAATGSENRFARGDHVHPTDTSRASASSVTALSDRVDSLETAVGTGGSVDTKIANAIAGLDSSVSATSNQAIASVTIVDGKITGSTKVTVPTNNNQLTNGAGYQTASDVATAISTALASAVEYKGTVATVANLPSSGNKTGDMYHVTATGGEYAWDGSAWQEMGSIIDLSGYVEDSDLVAITNSEIDTIVAS